MVTSYSARRDPHASLGLSDRDVLLARLDRIDDLLTRIARIEEAQQRILALLSDGGKEQTPRAPVNFKRFIRRPEVTSLCGLSRSTLYMRIGERLFPAPIRLGARMVAWRYGEVVAVNEARLRGATDDELRELVGVVEAARNSGEQ